jgi:ABC-2 type transport system permease protein
MLRLQLIGLQTMVTKETKRIFRIWVQTLLPSVTSTALYFLVFGSFIGSRIGTVSGVSYISFIIPGLIMMSVITNSYSNVVSVVFGSKFQKSIEELLISPLYTSTIILGWVSSGVVRGSIVGVLVLLISTLFVPFQMAHPLIILYTLLCTSLLFSICGAITAIFAKSFDHLTIVPVFILTPLSYLGGVFYSIKTLPEFWQNVSKFNPIFYLINTFRFGFIGISDVPISIALVVLTSVTAASWGICYYLVKNGIGLRS